MSEPNLDTTYVRLRAVRRVNILLAAIATIAMMHGVFLGILIGFLVWGPR